MASQPLLCFTRCSTLAHVCRRSAPWPPWGTLASRMQRRVTFCTTRAGGMHRLRISARSATSTFLSEPLSPLVQQQCHHSTITQASSANPTPSTEVSDNGEEVGTTPPPLSDALFGFTTASPGTCSALEPFERVAQMSLFDDWVKEVLFLRSGWLAQIAQVPSVADGTSRTAQPPLSIEVVGRSKLIRFLLRSFLHRQELWVDELREVVELTWESLGTLEEKSDGGEDAHSDVDLNSRPAVPAFLLSQLSSMPILLNGQNAALFSPSTLAVLRSWVLHEKAPPAPLHSSAAQKRSTDGGRHVWSSFVVAHRHDVLPSPQRPPFSFGEMTPHLTPNDFDTPPEVPAPCTVPPPQKEEWPPERWNALTEDQQNTVLFGASSAFISSRATSAARQRGDGVFMIYSFEREDLPKNTDEGSTDHAAEVTDTASDADLHTAAQRRREVYDVDTFMLGIVECVQSSHDADHVAQVVGRARRQGRLPPRQYLPNGCFRCDDSPNDVEDVQLSALWTTFQDSDLASLLENHRGLVAQPCQTSRRVAQEVVVQSAVLLLFFSRDEVKAVTPPERTFQILWYLHHQLRDWMTILANLHGKQLPHPTPAAPLPANAPSIVSSYSCFGLLTHSLSAQLADLRDAAGMWRYVCTHLTAGPSAKTSYRTQVFNLLAQACGVSEDLSSVPLTITDGEQLVQVKKRRGRPPKVSQQTLELEDVAVDDDVEQPAQVKKRRGRPPKVSQQTLELEDVAVDDDVEEPAQVKKRRGRPPKMSQQTLELEDVAADDDVEQPAQVKKRRGRPPKMSQQTLELEDVAVDDDVEEPAQVKKRRGRPPKMSQQTLELEDVAADDDVEQPAQVKKRRGRPPKMSQQTLELEGVAADDDVEEPAQVKKRRGRPPKMSQQTLELEDVAADDDVEQPVQVKKRRGRPPKVA